MAQFNKAMVVFVVLCSGSQVHSDKVRIRSETYLFGNKELIVGDNIISERTLVYALCDTEDSKTLASCNVIFHSDVFNNEEPKSCGISFPTRQRRYKVQIVEVNNWVDNKVILMWREVNIHDLRKAEVKLYIIQMDTCEKIEHEEKITNNDYMILELYYFPYRNCFDILIMIADSSNDKKFSQWTIFDDGESKKDTPSFTQTGVAHAFQPIDGTTSKLLVIGGGSQGEVDIYLMNDEKKTPLGQHLYVPNFGLSTAGGLISYCALKSCIQFDYKGEHRQEKNLDLLYNPVEYLALYNLVNGQMLALICDGQPGPYRFLRIGIHGEQLFSFQMEGTDCQNKPANLKSRFYVRSNTKYCLSLFHSLHTSLDGAKFSEYCFSIY